MFIPLGRIRGSTALVVVSSVLTDEAYFQIETSIALKMVK